MSRSCEHLGYLAGPVPDNKGKPRDEQMRLSQEYRSKWREESMDWNDFEATWPGNWLDIHHAQLARNDSTVALQVEGMLMVDECEEKYVTFFVRAGGISIQQSDGVQLSVENFVSMGEAYWDSFDTRSSG